jgi:hypothetical protein
LRSPIHYKIYEKERSRMIDDLHREADALPTLRTRSWVILGLLTFGIAAWGAAGWLFGQTVDAARAIGLPV